MERRVTSHTEEEEMNQRRRLLTLARKGDQKSIELLFELYQVKVFSGDALKKKKLPSFPVLIKPSNGSGKGGSKAAKHKAKASKGSLPDSKPKKGEKGTIGEATKPSLKKKSIPKKASLSKKKTSGKASKKKNLTSAKKPRIAKKK